MTAQPLPHAVVDRRLQKAALLQELEQNRRAVLVVNTRSRRGGFLFRKARRALREAGLTLEETYAVRQGERLPDIVRRLVDEGHKYIIVGGGDGTISSVAGYFAYRDVVFGLLPVGTANSFARTLGIPLDLEGAVDVLVNGKVADVDLARINDSYFANGASIGLPAAIGKTIPARLKRWFGRGGYMLAAIPRFFEHRPFRCRITARGRTITLDALDLRIASGQYQGGVLVAEEADVDDGEIAIHVFTGRSRWSLAAEWVRTTLRLPLPRGDMEMLKAHEVLIETAPRQDISVDGEVTTRTPAHVSVARNALLLMVPRDFADRD